MNSSKCLCRGLKQIIIIKKILKANCAVEKCEPVEMLRELMTSRSVSYTHLDVYKRQL